MNKKIIKSTAISILLLFLFVSIFSNIQAINSSPHSVKGILYINNEIPTSDSHNFEQIIVKFIFEDNLEESDTIYEYDIYEDLSNYNVGFWNHEGETADIKVEYYGYEITPDDNKTIQIDSTIGYIIDLHISVDEPDNEPPSKVTGLTLTDAKDGKLDLSWDAATDDSGIDHYNIYRDGVKLADEPTGTSFQDTGLNNGQEYCYKVSAVDTSENEGEKSDQDCAVPTKTITPNNPPNKPINPKPENNSDKNSLNPTLKIYVYDLDNDKLKVDFYNASDDTLIQSLNNIISGTNPEITWNDLSYNKTYFWYVKVNDSEYSKRSDVFNFKTKEKEDTPPEIKITFPNKGGIYLKDKIYLEGILNRPLIIGNITIKVDATDDNGVDRVEFYIKGIKNPDGELIKEDSSNPYTANWDIEEKRFIHLYIIKVVAYDESGKSSSDEVLVRKFF